MTNYHLTDDGPKICAASIKPCPVGGTHFDNAEAAQKSFEMNMAESNPTPSFTKHSQQEQLWFEINQETHEPAEVEKIITSFGDPQRGHEKTYVNAIYTFVRKINKSDRPGAWSAKLPSPIPVQTQWGKITFVQFNHTDLTKKGAPEGPDKNNIIFKLNNQTFRIDGTNKCDGWGTRWGTPYEVKD